MKMVKKVTSDNEQTAIFNTLQQFAGVIASLRLPVFKLSILGMSLDIIYYPELHSLNTTIKFIIKKYVIGKSILGS